jgi:EpsI family protein
MEVFGIDMPAPTPKNVDSKLRKIPLSFSLVGVMVFMVFVLSVTLPEREELVPERLNFTEFPMQIDKWQGKTDSLESIILDELRLNDYIMADYTDGVSAINFYVAYYESQRKGQSAHSPRTCLPGGGWKISKFGSVNINETGKYSLAVNRVVIAKGEYKQLVYYWFQGRGRDITNEYLVKWFIFWDSLVKHRTDGALVRLTTVLQPGQSIGDADKKLREFIAAVSSVLDDYIPDEDISVSDKRVDSLLTE